MYKRQVLEALQDPRLVLLDEANQPDSVPRAKVMVSDTEWPSVAKLLFDEGIVLPIPDEDVARCRGEMVLNGLFGVEKPSRAPDGSEAQGPVALRTIMNLVPSNSLQVGITGDIHTLPSPARWRTLHLSEDVALVWSEEDIQCMFYVFEMHPAWRPYFTFSKRVSWEALGVRRSGSTLLASRVLPMGWVSATGCAQQFLRRLATLPIPRGAGELMSQELRKDRPSPFKLGQAVVEIWMAYLDNKCLSLIHI